MSLAAAREYVRVVRVRYLNGNRAVKGRILEELCDVFGYNRKSAIRTLHEPVRKLVDNEMVTPASRTRGRRSVYRDDADFCETLRRLWFVTDQPCMLNFKAAIPLWLPAYEEEHEVSPSVREKLLKVSAATIGRLLEPSKERSKKRCGTKPGSLLRTEIPIRTNFWDVNRPGYVEADTVAHCGGSMSGEFVWTLTLTDIETTWTENRAVWNKVALDVKDSIIDIEEKLPFSILGFDSDNGGEFINKALVHYFSGKFIAFTRSREYQKNDNAHVEQKNYTHVRDLLGYDRIDNRAAVALLNDVYRNELSLLRNHFRPCLKLGSKERVQSKLRRYYGVPKTPYERVLESDHITVEVKERLIAQHKELNPIKLKRIVHQKLRQVFRMVREQFTGEAA